MPTLSADAGRPPPPATHPGSSLAAEPAGPRSAAALRDLPWQAILELLDSLLVSGIEKDEAIALVRAFLDDTLVFDRFGLDEGTEAALEAADGVVIEAFLRLAWGVVARRHRRLQRRHRRQGRNGGGGA